jgi:hypothetical protein
MSAAGVLLPAPYLGGDKDDIEVLIRSRQDRGLSIVTFSVNVGGQNHHVEMARPITLGALRAAMAQLERIVK